MRLMTTGAHGRQDFTRCPQGGLIPLLRGIGRRDDLTQRWRRFLYCCFTAVRWIADKVLPAFDAARKAA